MPRTIDDVLKDDAMSSTPRPADLIPAVSNTSGFLVSDGSSGGMPARVAAEAKGMRTAMLVSVRPT